MVDTIAEDSGAEAAERSIAAGGGRSDRRSAEKANNGNQVAFEVGAKARQEAYEVNLSDSSWKEKGEQLLAAATMSFSQRHLP